MSENSLVFPRCLRLSSIPALTDGNGVTTSSEHVLGPHPLLCTFPPVSIPPRTISNVFGSNTHLLEVTPEVVYRRERQLVLVRIAQLLVVSHQLVFV